MKRYRSALMAGLLALAVAVCDDDGTVVQPPPVVNVSPPDVTVTVPPAPPVVAPLTAMITPPAAEASIGGMVDFAVGTSGGSGAASWTCTSSDTAVATVETTDTGCRATAVAGGGVTVTAAVTKGSESTNVAAQLTVSTTADAFIIVTNVSGDMMTDASGLKGSVDVTVSVERGNQTFERLSLNVDGMEVASQDFGTAAAADDAEQSVHDFTLSFNSASYDEHGDHVDVDYMNGEHMIQALLKVAGRDALLTSNMLAVEFANADGMHLNATLPSNSALDSDGGVWYGGPGTTLEIMALPVLYSGGSASSVTMMGFCGADAATDDEAPFEFAPDCEDEGETYEGVSPEFALTVGGESISVMADDILNDDVFPINLDYEGPGAPTFKPNPNDREGGWINAGVAFTSTSSRNKDAWLSSGGAGGGVGGYTPQLRFAAVPRGDADGGLTEALEATPLQMVPVGVAVPDSRADAYCVIASAVDKLGNESALPDDEDGMCQVAGNPSVAAVEDDPATTGVDETMAAVEATGYFALLEALEAAEEAEDDEAIEDATDALVDAGLRAGVDTSPPTAEFAGASLAKNSKIVNPDTDPTDEVLPIQYILHLDDNRGLRAGEPVVDTLVHRDDDDDLDGVMTTVAQAADDSPLYNVSFANDGVGYYTYMAQAQDMAGNLSEGITRTALHDTTQPVSALIFARGDDAFEYDKTLVMADNLSVRDYSMVVQAPNLPTDVDGVRLKRAMVDAYNGDLTQSETLRGAVEIPFIAVVDAADGAVAAGEVITSITAYVTDQAGNSDNDVETLSFTVGTASSDDIEEDEGILDATGADGYSIEVEDDDGAITAAGGTNPSVTKSDETITLTVTADVPLATTANPFANGVLFYAEVDEIGTGLASATTDRTELRLIGMVAGNSAELDTDTSREWTYETEVSADDFYAIVGSSADAYPVHALGINDKGVAFVMSHDVSLTIARR